MREIKISQETASRWYNGTDSELKALALQTYPELAIKELPKTWEGLKNIEGYYTNVSSEIFYDKGNAIEYNRNFFATKEQASAAIAMAQLSQLMAVYNDGWVANYRNGNYKYGIYYYKDEINLGEFSYGHQFLVFKDRATSKLFLENFKDLINIAKPLL